MLIKNSLIAIMLCIASQVTFAANTTADNPFGASASASQTQSATPARSTPARASSSSDCSGLPRVCGQMANCAQARKALQCGNKRLDRDRDGVPCESICR